MSNKSCLLPLAHSCHTLYTHDRPHNAAVQGLERRDLLQHQLLQAQLTHQPLQLRVRLLQLLRAYACSSWFDGYVHDLDEDTGCAGLRRTNQADKDGGEGGEGGDSECDEQRGGCVGDGEGGPGGEDPEGHIGRGGEVDPVGELVLVVEEVHLAEGAVDSGGREVETEEDDGEEVEGEDDGGPKDGGVRLRVARGEQIGEGYGEEYVECGAGVDKGWEVGHVGESVHLVQLFVGGVHGVGSLVVGCSCGLKRSVGMRVQA